MAEESDGIEEALESSVRLAAMAGARLGSEIARAHEDRLREQRLIDAREPDQLAQRFEAEKQAAVVELSQVHRSDWWERAEAERIGQTYATARAWAPEVGEAARAEQKMRAELRDRYGVDVDQNDPRTVAADVEAWRRRLEQQRRQTAEQPRTAETAEAAALLAVAAREDRQADAALEDERIAEAERLYDSADRRAADAEAMAARGIDPDVAQSRMHADTGAAMPPTLATRGVRRGRAPKARKAAGRGAQVERSGVER